MKKLGFIEKYGFYLAGGTALALQIGHRDSLDFDFYTEKKFDSQKLREEFEEEAKLLFVLKLYELGKISSGKAARLAGLSRVAFLLKLGQYKVSPFQVGLEEIVKESNK